MDEEAWTVRHGVYTPADDTAFLREVLEQQDLAGRRVCDMGTGTGVLAYIAAQHGATVVAVDSSETAVKNARTILDARDDVTVVESDLFEGVDGTFDCIVCNPPYAPFTPTGEKEAVYGGGRFGRRLIDRFIVQAPHHLAPDGTILLLQTVRNGVDPTLSRLQEQGLDAERHATRDLDNATLVVVRAINPHRPNR